MEFDVIQGDIAAQSADVLVTAAGTSLMMDTSGTGTALLKAGGEALGEEAVEKGPIELGDIAVTDAYDLDAGHVIHAAAAHFGGNATADHIRDATRRTLEKADELGARTLVMPAIGCGLAGFDIDEGGRIIFEVIAAYEPTSLEQVTIIGFTDEEFDELSALAAEFGA